MEVSHVVLGDAGVILGHGRGHEVVVFGVDVCCGGFSLQVRAVPRGELVLASFAEGRSDVALRVVGPALANVQVLDELDGVSAPELLRGDQATRGHDATSGQLSTFLDAGAFQHDALLADGDILLYMARVERASSSNRDIVSNLDGGRHARGQGSSSVDNAVVSNRGEVADAKQDEMVLVQSKGRNTGLT